MMDTVEELRQDVEEMRDMLVKATRSRVKDIIGIEVRKLELELMRLTKLTSEPVKSGEEPPKKTRPQIQTKTIHTYAWDQSDKFMKIYVTVNGVHSLPKDRITCEFGKRSFRLQVEEEENKRRSELYISTLLDDIVPEDSWYKVKTDTVLLMLKKSTVGKTWPYVTSGEKAAKKAMEEKEKKPKVDDDKDPNDSMMDMLKKMYDEGDDDMRRTIAQAWTQSRDKPGAP
ncbi:calcyclin-binding protein-like [Ostrea edulis]|uniref:calcyclin-binding protein-like n=1 Tax=Ostrea edulis TaxID=37623 RepID=UPI0024AED756|nr:calcyclin-binding protein-like [Ostrea edulis]XP_056010502.1 calcyclin-binding protein-like [Ostrea edulis]